MTIEAIDSRREQLRRGEPVLVCEEPFAPGPEPAALQGPFRVSGYALAPGGIEHVDVLIDGRLSYPAERTRRPDVRYTYLDALTERPEFLPGFAVEVPTENWAPGRHQLTVTARAAGGKSRTIGVELAWLPSTDALRVKVAAGEPILWWACPTVGDPPADEFVNVRGWAAAPNGIDRVTVALGSAEPVVAHTTAGPLYQLEGFRGLPAHLMMATYDALLDARGTGSGPHSLTVTARAADGREVTRSGRIVIDAGERYRRWRAAREAPLSRPRASIARAPHLEVCLVDTEGADGEALLASLAGQTHDNWSVRLAGTAVRLSAGPAWERLRAAGRVRPPAASLDDALATDADGLILASAGIALDPYALERLGSELSGPEPADLVYADEDALDAAGRRASPIFKPGWSEELLLAWDYIGGLAALGAAATAAARERGEAPATCIHELVVRLVDTPLVARHVPEVLHTRAGPPAPRAGDDALQAVARRRGCEVVLEAVPDRPALRRLRWPLSRRPHVTVLIPTTGCSELLGPCLRSLRTATGYDPMEVVLVASGGGEAAAVAEEELGAAIPYRVVASPDAPDGSFNFSRACNAGLAAADGTHVLFLNDDVEAIEPGWLEAMVEQAELPRGGVVGARLLWPDRLVQSSGIGLYCFGPRSGLSPADLFRGLEARSTGPYDLLVSTREVSAVTGACMLVSRKALEAVNGWDDGFNLDYGDIDLCLRVRQAGFRVVVIGHVTLIHRESATRQGRCDRERLERLVPRWAPFYRDGDPFIPPVWERAREPMFAVPGDIA